MFKLNSRLLFFLAVMLTSLVLLATAAQAAPTVQTDKPSITIDEPFSNTTYTASDTVNVMSTSASPIGIVQVDLYVDGIKVRSDLTPNNVPQLQYRLLQPWTAVGGTHVLTVISTDSENQRSDPASVTVIVVGATPTPPPTAVPTSTPEPATCTLSSKFIADVSIPDNTVIAPGGTFVKTWAIQNNGTCPWDNTYTAVFVGGEQMAGPSPSPIPNALPGQTINISINFVAPATPGAHRSTWQIRAGNGVNFGTFFYVLIQVPGPPTPVPTPVPPPPPPSGCQGAPQISSFTVDNSTINSGQSTTLRWGFVGNADYVSLQTPNGNGGVPTPGSQGINPGSTTTYTLAAYCKGFQVTAQVTVYVNGAPPPPPPSANASINSVQVSQNGGNKYSVRVYYSWDGGDGPAVVTAQGFNGSGGAVTNTANTNARTNAPYANLNLTANGRLVRVQACVVGRDGNELACGSN